VELSFRQEEREEESSPASTEPWAGTPSSGRGWYRLYLALLGPILFLYILFDRGFAHVHVPGTPLYVGESLLCVGVMALLSGTHYVRRAITREPLLALMGVFMLWGLARTLPNISSYGVLNCLQDAALWYYCLFAFLIVAASIAFPEAPDRLTKGFQRVLPWILVWLPIAALLPKVGIAGPDLPTSDVAFFTHKIGNIEVVIAMCLGVLWLLPNDARSKRSRNLLSLVALFGLMISATQSRGGAVAALIASAFGFFLMSGKRPALIALAKGLVVAGLLFGLAWTTNFTVHTSKRDLSVQQLITNAESVTGGNQLQGTITWRENLWRTIVSKEVSSGKLAIGFGMGPNLALLAGLPERQAENPALELRSPHDSHIDVLARMGVIGAAMWLLLWIGWTVMMFRARSRLKRSGSRYSRGVIELCLVSVVAILTNCIFDPTLEGAQVAALTWTVFGIGLVVARRAGQDSQEDVVVVARSSPASLSQAV